MPERGAENSGNRYIQAGSERGAERFSWKKALVAFGFGVLMGMALVVAASPAEAAAAITTPLVLGTFFAGAYAVYVRQLSRK